MNEYRALVDWQLAEDHSTRAETSTNGTLSTTNSTWNELGLKPYLHKQKPMNNVLGYDMAYVQQYTL